jgi:hypothetical protein
VRAPPPPVAGTSGVVFVTETVHLLGVGPTTLVLLDRPQPAGAQSSIAIAIDAGSEREPGTLRAAMARSDPRTRAVESARGRDGGRWDSCKRQTWGREARVARAHVFTEEGGVGAPANPLPGAPGRVRRRYQGLSMAG